MPSSSRHSSVIRFAPIAKECARRERRGRAARRNSPRRRAAPPARHAVPPRAGRPARGKADPLRSRGDHRCPIPGRRPVRSRSPPRPPRAAFPPAAPGGDMPRRASYGRTPPCRWHPGQSSPDRRPAPPPAPAVSNPEIHSCCWSRAPTRMTASPLNGGRPDFPIWTAGIGQRRTPGRAY
jgi:hypothetical protein